MIILFIVVIVVCFTISASRSRDRTPAQMEETRKKNAAFMAGAAVGAVDVTRQVIKNGK